MHVPLLVSQPDTRRAIFKNEDLILTKVLMAGDLRAEIDLFRRATSVAIHLLAFILLEDKRLRAASPEYAVRAAQQVATSKPATVIKIRNRIATSFATMATGYSVWGEL